jgi:hypothetical protein
MNDYIRFPSKWKIIEENLSLLDKTPDNVEVTIACAVQMLNMYYIPDFIKWKLTQGFKKINLNKNIVGEIHSGGIFSAHLVWIPTWLSLKVLPKESRAFAPVSGDYKLAPAYSKGINLPKVLYIPIGSELTYSVEYRPAIGNDSGLSMSKLQVPGVNSFYTNTPSHGLQLRMLPIKGTQFKDSQPTFSNYQINLIDKLDIKIDNENRISKVHKLITTLKDKQNYVIHHYVPFT